MIRAEDVLNLCIRLLAFILLASLYEDGTWSV